MLAACSINVFTFKAGRDLLSSYRLAAVNRQKQPDYARILPERLRGAIKKNKYLIFAAILKLERNNDTANNKNASKPVVVPAATQAQ